MKRLLSRGDNLYPEDVFWVLFDYEVTCAQNQANGLSLIQIEATPNSSCAPTFQTASIFCLALNSHLRFADIPTKSGSLYYVLLPNTDEREARTVCDRVLSIFRNRFVLENGFSVTFSINIGMASHEGGPTLTKEELLWRANEAFKNSKAKGPNTYVALSGTQFVYGM